MLIKNITLKDRYCEDKLIKAGEEVEVEGKKYEKSASLSPEIFEIKKQKTIKKVKTNGSK